MRNLAKISPTGWMALWIGLLPAVAFGNVFGLDHRVPMVRTDKPWSAIGYLSSICTGTLISRDFVLTAAHCAQAPKGQKLIFYPNGIDGKAKDWSEVVRVWKGTRTPDQARAKDWAILKLQKPLGEKYGWIETGVPTGLKMQLVGYSEDFLDGKTPSIDEDCELKAAVGALLAHDCDGTRGNSGGPLLEIRNGVPVLVALSVSEYRANGETSLHLESFSGWFTNVALSTQAFERAIHCASKYPQRRAHAKK